MTGFGQEDGEICGLAASVVIRSVNNKSLDWQIRMPKVLFPIETKIRNVCMKKISRGRIELYIQLRSMETSLYRLRLDEGKAASIHEAFEHLKRTYDLKGTKDLENWVLMPDLFVEEPNAIDEEALFAGVLQFVEEALDRFVASRKEEGLRLKSQCIEEMDALKNQVEGLDAHIDTINEEYKKRLYKRLEDFEITDDLSESRFQQEILYFLDRSDVSEEITRLKSHITQFYTLMEDTKPIGKRVDFLLQEMNREANTIASKAQHIDQTRSAMHMKVHIERIREQIMNIE